MITDDLDFKVYKWCPTSYVKRQQGFPYWGGDTQHSKRSTDFCASRNRILPALMRAWKSFYNLKHVKTTDLLNAVETKGYHKVRTFLNIKTLRGRSTIQPLFAHAEKLKEEPWKPQRCFRWKILNLWPFLGHFCGVFSLTLNEVVEACPFSSTGRKLLMFYNPNWGTYLKSTT